jgi:PAS domain S-box-containing protein
VKQPPHLTWVNSRVFPKGNSCEGRQPSWCYSRIPIRQAVVPSAVFLFAGLPKSLIVGSSQIVLSLSSLMLILITLVVAWVLTVILFLMRRNQEKKKYIRLLETHLLEKAETSNALQRSEERYEQLIHNMNEGLIFTDAENIIRFANARACSILMGSPGSLPGKGLNTFVLGETPVLRLPGREDKPQARTPHREEVQMVRGDGEVIWACLSISYPAMGNAGQGGAVIVMTDITEKKNAEHNLNEITVDLNQKIKQLNCLFDISDITGAPGISFDDIFERCLEIIPNGLKYSHDVCTEISFGDKRYASASYIETPWSFSVPIRAQKKKLGQIRVGYLEEKPRIKKDPFHINEKILLKNIAEKLGQIIEARNNQQTLHTTLYGKSAVDK